MSNYAPSDEGSLPQPSSDSFWEVGNYKTTVKRMEDGYRLCNELMTMVKERCEIEKSYAKALKHWAKKWNKSVEEGPEYGTMSSGWKSFCTEAERVHDLHMEVRDKLISDVQEEVATWQKENYKKLMMTGFKETKEADDAFRKAQKPWAKMLQRVNQSKKAYHTACRNEKTAINAENNGKKDTSISPDKVKALRDRVEKCKAETTKTKDKYDKGLQEINGYNAKYMEDMTLQFQKCQEFEEKRLQFFKQTLLNMHQCLDLSVEQRFPQIYTDLQQSIVKVESGQDLKFWAKNHGTEMGMNWPQFEEYNPELRAITKKSKKNVANEGITMTNITPLTENYQPNSYHHQQAQDSQKLSRRRTLGWRLPGLGARPRPKSMSDTCQQQSSLNNSPAHDQRHNSTVMERSSSGSVDDYDDTKNPFAEDDNPTSKASSRPTSNTSNTAEWSDEDEANPFTNGGGGGSSGTGDAEVGVPVRALYDYEGQEDDELTFKAGDLLTKLEDEDEQGWCKGKFRGRAGLYPANYVEAV
ncbi:protein kinase C and casein kinase substrate in neurons protein 2-like isoform X4 [Branchiostoma lanceolatum]|uniref:protein kinase C and casein kinase substrate in neurons protein 2-like isoform X4 n=1 Tax=Branchiostoma lanceolatum TaxID=7740 RepID=UPI0034553D7E